MDNCAFSPGSLRNRCQSCTSRSLWSRALAEADVGGIPDYWIRCSWISAHGRLPFHALFTIDDEGRVVVHAKYSGLLCIDLMKLVKKIAADP
jgi:hypothetical protein